MTKPDESAFPRSLPTGYIKAGDVDAAFWERQAKGMNLREYYAGLAMQGLLANAHFAQILVDKDSKYRQEFYAKLGIQIADALIAELGKSNSDPR